MSSQSDQALFVEALLKEGFELHLVVQFWLWQVFLKRRDMTRH